MDKYTKIILLEMGYIIYEIFNLIFYRFAHQTIEKIEYELKINLASVYLTFIDQTILTINLSRKVLSKQIKS